MPAQQQRQNARAAHRKEVGQVEEREQPRRAENGYQQEFYLPEVGVAKLRKLEQKPESASAEKDDCRLLTAQKRLCGAFAFVGEGRENRKQRE